VRIDAFCQAEHRSGPFVEASLPAEILVLLAHQVESRIDAVLTSSASLTPAALNEFLLLSAWIPRLASLDDVPIGVFKAALLVQNLLPEGNSALVDSALLVSQQSTRLIDPMGAKLRAVLRASLRDLLLAPTSSAS
jgi:hypothetical protein